MTVVLYIKVQYSYIYLCKFDIYKQSVCEQELYCSFPLIILVLYKDQPSYVSIIDKSLVVSVESLLLVRL